MLAKRIVFLLHLVALVLYRIYGYSGHFGFDDIEYAHMAYELSQGNFIAENHFSYRLAITIPTAISYMLFGVNDWASSIPPMIASMLILTLVYQFVKRQNILTVSLALSFTLFTEWFLFYGNKLMVDIYVCLAFTGFIYVFYHYFFVKTKSVKLYAFVLAACLFYGLNAKGTIILILPLLLFLFFNGIKKRENQKLWQFTFLFSTMFLLMYLLLSKLVTGDYFSRFYAITENSYMNKCSYASQPLKVQLYRIAIDFWRMLKVDGFALVSLIAMAPLISIRGYGLFRLKGPDAYLVSVSFILLLSSNFMTITPTAYNPMCLDFRHYLFLVPVMAITAARTIGDWEMFKKVDWLIIVGLVLLISIDYIDTDSYLYRLYVPALIVVLLFTILKRNNILKSSNFLFFLIPVLLIQPYFMVSSANEVAYDKQREIIKQQFSSKEEKKVILTDPVQKNFGRYWNEFDEEKNVFIDFNQYSDDSILIRPDYLLLNPYTQFYAGVSHSDLPLAIQYLVKSGKSIFYSEQPKIELIKLNKKIENDLGKHMIFKTVNQYSETDKGWSFNKDALKIEDDNIYEKVWEYSSTYRFKLDSIQLDTNQFIRLKISVDTKFLEETNASIIATVIGTDSTYYWSGKPVNDYQRAYGNWWTVETAFKIPIKQLSNNSELLIYLWNTDKKDAHIDNFEIEAYQF